MRYLLLQPEVAGGLREQTTMDASVHPPVVTQLHYEVLDWLGDDLLESFPCFLISPEAAAALTAAGMRSFALADALITLEPQMEDLYDHRVLTFRWLQPTGQPGVDDIALDERAHLIVSENAWNVLSTFSIAHCTSNDWTAD